MHLQDPATKTTRKYIYAFLYHWRGDDDDDDDHDDDYDDDDRRREKGVTLHVEQIVEVVAECSHSCKMSQIWQIYPCKIFGPF